MNGWASLTRDPQLSDFISTKDILLLQETWTTYRPTFNGFQAYSIDAVPGAGHGRHKGGLATLISTALSGSVSLLPPFDRYALSLLLQFRHFALLIINIYMPPLRKRARITKIWSDLEVYVNHLIQDYPNACLILGGDANARMATDNCSLYRQHKTYPPTEEIDTPFSLRNSRDQKSNLAGLLLNQMAFKMDLHILNGAYGKDQPASFTYISGSRMSQIDYFLVSDNVIHLLKDLEVVPKFFSDHFPVLLSMKKCQLL